MAEPCLTDSATYDTTFIDIFAESADCVLAECWLGKPLQVRTHICIAGFVKKAFVLTFDQGGMGNRIVDFSDRYQRIKVPSEFPRACRMLTASPDLKASEWRTIGIVAFVLLNEVFDVEFPERNLAKSRMLSKLRYFWLLTVSAV